MINVVTLKRATLDFRGSGSIEQSCFKRNLILDTTAVSPTVNFHKYPQMQSTTVQYTC